MLKWSSFVYSVSARDKHMISVAVLETKSSFQIVSQLRYLL